MIKCDFCNGTGSVVQSDDGGVLWREDEDQERAETTPAPGQTLMVCPACGGNGEVPTATDFI